MSAEDLAVSCIEDLGSSLKKVLITISIMGLVLGSIFWYLTSYIDNLISYLATTSFLIGIGAIIANGFTMIYHEAKVKELKRSYRELSRIDSSASRIYEMFIDVISWILNECKGRVRASFDSSLLTRKLSRSYSDVIDILFSSKVS